AFALFRTVVVLAPWSGAHATAANEAVANTTATNRRFGSFIVILSLKNYMRIGRTKRLRLIRKPRASVLPVKQPHHYRLRQNVPVDRLQHIRARGIGRKVQFG